MSMQVQVMEKKSNIIMFEDAVLTAVRNMFPTLDAGELQLFAMVCQRTGLDPILKQIYAVKRKDWKLGREVMTIQTGIDGFRMIAERSECYAPGPEPTWAFDSNGNLLSATAYIKKMTKDGTWHTVGATAFFDEYCQKKEGKPTGFWLTMPKGQNAKCAEALAFRKAFPNIYTQLYAREEMEQSENEPVKSVSKKKEPTLIEPPKETPRRITQEQVTIIENFIGNDSEVKKLLLERMALNSVHSIPEIYASWFDKVIALIQENKQKKAM